MDEAVQCRKPVAVVTIDGKETSPSLVSVSFFVDRHPTATVQHHPDRVEATEKPVSLTSKDITDSMAERQESIFTKELDPGKPTFTLQMSDGNENFLEFEGFPVSPSRQFSRRVAQMSDQFVHVSALMDNISFGIFSMPQTDLLDLTPQTIMDPGEKVPDYISRVFTLMQDELVTKRLSSWDERNLNKNAATDIFLKRQHELNEKYKDLLHRCMKKSSSAWGWEDIVEQLKGQESYLSEFVWRQLTSQSRSLFSTLLTLAQNFQCFYRPPGDAELVGTFVNRQYMYDAPQTLVVDPEMFTLGVGMRGLLPIRYVGIVRDVLDSILTLNGTDGQFSAIYPEDADLAGSTGLMDPGPAWIQYVNAYDAPAQFAVESSMPLTLSGMLSYIRQTISKRMAQATRSSTLLQQWARTQYIWAALQQASATITQPMDLTIVPGRCYDVWTREGHKIFTGFLEGVTHTLAINGGSGSCVTELQFTGIEIGSFSLPGK